MYCVCFLPPYRLALLLPILTFLFEREATTIFATDPEIFTAPALPIGRSFSGIVHVHGDLGRPSAMVLTDTEFGRAYLTEGWARRFLVDIFRYYSVLFVGYSHDDTVMNYLARSLPSEDTKERFALTTENETSRWQNLGIRPIVYPVCDGAYTGLYRGVAGLAQYTCRGTLEWRQELATIARKDPCIS